MLHHPGTFRSSRYETITLGVGGAEGAGLVLHTFYCDAGGSTGSDLSRQSQCKMSCR